MDNMEFKTIPMQDLPAVLEIFRHDNLRCADGTYPEENWIRILLNGGMLMEII